MTEDPFATAAIRRQVLDGWSRSTPRFREDANAEEDLVLGGYRDRLVVELAQNAADAASRAGVPGRLLLALRPPAPSTDGRAVLVAANTGAPLDSDGVQALATLRASAKRDGETVGRFGVGFAAVLAVTDEPVVLSRTGGVRFSAADTRDLIAAAGAPALNEERIRRNGQVPLLRLPFATKGAPPDGYDTAVVLPLRDQAAEDLAIHLLSDVADALLIALPALDEIVVEVPDRPPRVLREVTDRWHILTRSGHLPPAVLAGRPVEERNRTFWRVTWALPKPPEALESLADPDESPSFSFEALLGSEAALGAVDLGLPSSKSRGPARLSEPRVLHAPTPSDEPLPWPALLVATLPMDPSRRHVAPGPVAEHVLAEAAQGYTELLTERAQAGEPIWPLVVTGLPAGPVDGALRELVDRLLPGTPMLTAAEDINVLLRPRDALALSGPAGADPATVGVFAAWLAGLVLAPRPANVAFRQLGVRRLSLAEAVELLPALPDPARWHGVYSALAPLAGDAEVREALAFLPIPLADGTVIRGMRGLAMPLPGFSAAAASPGLDLAAEQGTASGLRPDGRHPHPDVLKDTRHPLDASDLDVPGGWDRDQPSSSFGELTVDSLTSTRRLGVTEALALLGARVVHPRAAHPLLERLGAIPAGPRALLELPVVRAAVEDLEDLPDLEDADAGRTEERVRDAVLSLVATAVEAGELGSGDLAWLGNLALPDDSGEPTPAAALALPDSPAADWFDPDEIGLLAREIVAAWTPETLAAIGVLRGPGLLRAADVPVHADLPVTEDDDDDSPSALLDGWLEWCAQLADQLDGLPPGAVLPELIAVRDLDAVRPELLPDVVAAIAADPDLRPALIAPARIVADGAPIHVASYTAWWLRSELLSPGALAEDLGGDGAVGAGDPVSEGPTALAAPDAAPDLRALLPPAPSWLGRLDPAAQRALGVLSDLEGLDAAAAPSLLARLADPRVEVAPPLLIRILTRFAELAAHGLRLNRPDQLRALDGDLTAVVPAEDVVVVEAPMYRQRQDIGYHLPAAPGAATLLSDLLELPLAAELAPGKIDPRSGTRQLVPSEVRDLLPAAPPTWWEHDELLVDGVGVDWWVDGRGRQGRIHAATTDGLARALAWAADRWDLRTLVAQLLTEPETSTDTLIDQVFSPT